MATFTLYVDDSGTHSQSPVAVAACFLSDGWRWDRFNGEWEDARQHPNEGFNVFHMADFVARQKEFKGWPDDKADRVMNRLMDIIERCTLAAFVSAVVKDDYDQIVTGRLREKLGGYHYTFAVQSCLAHISEWKATHVYGSGSVEYIFDRMSEGKREIVGLMDDLSKHELGQYVGLEPGGYSFENKADVLPLQSADILAWNGHRYVRDCQLPASHGQAEEGRAEYLSAEAPFLVHRSGGPIYKITYSLTRCSFREPVNH